MTESVETSGQVAPPSLHWRRMGLIYKPDGSGFFKTHAARPVPVVLDDQRLRIFFSSRDHDDRMLPTYIDVRRDNPSDILHVNDQPLVSLGAPGCFDDSGVTLGSIVDRGDTAMLFYTGWKRRRVISFELSIGVLNWDKKSGSVTRMFEGPVLAQDRNHPLLTAGPFVIEQNGVFRMWYCSGTGWRFPDGNPEPIYTVYYAESENGYDWKPRPGPLIQYHFDGEVISAPWVLPTAAGCHMWYSYRGHESREEKNYRIGYATSPDGLHWQRHDQRAGISVSEHGWDSEMICYPAIHREGSRLYMFYSGNGVGRGGMGWAETQAF